MRKINFSKNAESNLEFILDYLNAKFSKRVLDKFIKNLDKTVFLIQNNPEIFPLSSRNSKLRKCILSKQTTIYYKFSNEEINILSFFDTRQNPTKINAIK